MQPNVLVIMSDEFAPMFSRTHGHRLVHTPNMDRLAAEGVTFQSAHCNSPLCVPSRMSFMTGRYGSSVGVYDNASPLNSGVPTWARYGRSAGYDVALAGKHVPQSYWDMYPPSEIDLPTIGQDPDHAEVRQRLRTRLDEIVDLAALEHEVLASQAERMKVLGSTDGEQFKQRSRRDVRRVEDTGSQSDRKVAARLVAP